MVFDHMMKYIAENGESRYAFLLQTVMNEALDEMSEERDPENLAHWFSQFGQVVQWIGSGNIADLPESLRDIVAPKAELVSDSTHS
jgi:hypothetical protein